eukprot:scpid100474/ scgid19954/ 
MQSATCCRCNGNGTCVRCDCTKEGRKCRNCIPSKKNKCRNGSPTSQPSSQPSSTTTATVPVGTARNSVRDTVTDHTVSRTSTSSDNRATAATACTGTTLDSVPVPNVSNVHKPALAAVTESAAAVLTTTLLAECRDGRHGPPRTARSSSSPGTRTGSSSVVPVHVQVPNSPDTNDSADVDVEPASQVREPADVECADGAMMNASGIAVAERRAASSAAAPNPDVTDQELHSASNTPVQIADPDTIT